MGTVTILTNAERDIRRRDLLLSLTPPGEREDRSKRMSISAGIIIADAAGSSRSADLQTRTPLNEWQDQVRLADAPLGEHRDLLDTEPILTDAERDIRRRDLLESLKPPGEGEDRAKRMTISAGTIIAETAGSSR